MTIDLFPVPINGNNLSEAWAKAFLKAYDSPQGIVAPGIVSFPVDDDNPEWQPETANIRNALEDQLDRFGICSVNQSNIETVACTIFPESIWKRCGGDRKKLRDRYLKMWPQIKKCRDNRHGTYFKRLISYKEVDQLQEILKEWVRTNKKCRRSALQAGIFDPCHDYRPGPYLGFPCLQQLVFHPIGPKGRDGLKVVALYANQLLIEKAYGNYLGLYRLGRFMASEMELTLRGITCIATHLKRWNKYNKGDFKSLVAQLRKEVSDA